MIYSPPCLHAPSRQRPTDWGDGDSHMLPAQRRADRYLLLFSSGGRNDSLSEMARLSESKSQDAFDVTGRPCARFVTSRGETRFDELRLSTDYSHLMSDKSHELAFARTREKSAGKCGR